MHTAVKIARTRRVNASAITAAVALAFISAGAQAQLAMKPYYEFRKPRMLTFQEDVSLDTFGMAAPIFNTSGPYLMGFEGISQYDGATLGRNFIPPDTMGAVGLTQYMETSNGAYAIFDKTTGTRLSLLSDVSFWAAAGQTGTNGDSRVMYNADASRWVVVAFGSNVKDLQIAVSDTDNALGTWKSVKFEGYGGFGFGATADYPTLALDKNAVYIGTNNFAPATSGGANTFRGATLNVIPINSLFNAVAPTVTNIKQFNTPYTGAGFPTDADRGFAIQGVNSSGAGSTGRIVANSTFFDDNLAYTVNGLSASSATGATMGANVYSGQIALTNAGAARQPSVAVPANQRVVDSLDQRVSSSVYEVNGRIYMVQTSKAANGTDEARVRYTVLDSTTFAMVSTGEIGAAGYDYYQGSIAVNTDGEVVIGYNRSGLDVATGKISFMARTFVTAPDGSLVATSDEILLKESLTDDYHNGSAFGGTATGRQRWGDYSQVSVDPSDSNKFWLVGQFAREYNSPQFGHPGGSGFARWGTWVAVVDVSAVPEPSTWLMMVFGLGAAGAMARRQQRAASQPAQA